MPVRTRRNRYLEKGSRFATLEERLAAGKARREQVPRSSQAVWIPPRDRSDPVELLDSQNKTRVPELVPLRWGRMLESPFAFMRGSAIVMATDLASTPNSGIRVQACGDCHLLNFGAYATAERNLNFDINDFDETLPAPWEWDVKRLAASFELAGRFRSFKSSERADLVRAMVQTYREFMHRFAEMTALQVWYSRLDAATFERLFARTAAARKTMKRSVEQAKRRTLESAFVKMTKVINGRRRLVDERPVLFHIDERRGHPFLNAAFAQYMKTVRDDLRVLLDRYHVVDIAIKVVGVGSVGTRCGVLLLMANDGDPLLLQVKEANHSVLDVFAGKSKYHNHGQRIVVGQRIMQAASDAFLGWTTLRGRDYYVRQLRDMKWALDVEKAGRQRLQRYARGCAATLARAHARSTDPALLAGYLGSGATFDDAMIEFARAYADQSERDYLQLQAAAKAKRIKVTRG
ncbi:MAG: DUF2252 domain-containing protein [Candidatus Eremiobacteraeota bacterium]|nr:DUF2252 domain-containing protein [Candidatus Eremiobacteraeota bacterium]MBV8365532.1 DUF2252 domain-containing protein [Candidatus Eremiobacteraeota bacterium]